MIIHRQARGGGMAGKVKGGADAAVVRMLQASAPPPECGPEIPAAPARGAMVAIVPRRVEQTDAGPRVRRDGWQGRRAARAADAFDLTVARGAAPFRPSQVTAGRAYAELVERLASVGIKCSSIEGRTGSGGIGSSGLSEAVLDDLGRLGALHRAIGDGLALVPARALGRRKPLTVRVLVWQFCVGGKTLSEILAAHGWAASTGTARKEARRALADALTRMAGRV